MAVTIVATFRSVVSSRCAATSRTRQRPAMVGRSHCSGVSDRSSAMSSACSGPKSGAVSIGPIAIQGRAFRFSM
jgi:hypothetical protein